MKSSSDTPQFWLSRDGGRAEGPISLEELWDSWCSRQVVSGDQVCRVGSMKWTNPENVLRWRIWRPRLWLWGSILIIFAVFAAWGGTKVRQKLREIAEYEARPEVIEARRLAAEEEAATEKMRKKMNGGNDFENYSIRPSPWDGSVKEVKAFIERSVRDPSSLKYNHWSNRGSGQNLATTVDFTATNGFGGPSREIWLFQINRSSGEILEITDANSGVILFGK